LPASSGTPIAVTPANYITIDQFAQEAPQGLGSDEEASRPELTGGQSVEVADAP